MKKHILLFTLPLALLSCGENTTHEKEKREKDSLEAVVRDQQAEMTIYLNSFEEIERTLDSINLKQHNISVMFEKKSDVKPSAVAGINDDIKAINALLERNDKTIAALNQKIKKTNSRNKKLEELVKELNGRLADKQEELNKLNEKLKTMSTEMNLLQASVAFVTTESAFQEAIISEETETLHTAFYVVGTSRELQKNDIIDNKGGFLGIGRTKDLKNNFNEHGFTRIDNSETYVIPVNSKKAEVVTTHPAGSYQFDKDKDMIKSITITNPEEFWKASKYLVVVKS